MLQYLVCGFWYVILESMMESEESIVSKTIQMHGGIPSPMHHLWAGGQENSTLQMHKGKLSG